MLNLESYLLVHKPMISVIFKLLQLQLIHVLILILSLGFQILRLCKQLINIILSENLLLQRLVDEAFASE